MTDVKVNTPMVNMKLQRAVHVFRLQIRDREHFYKIVNWLNTNVGKGKDMWTMEGRVLMKLKTSGMASPNIYIFKPDFDAESSLFLSLI